MKNIIAIMPTSSVDKSLVNYINFLSSKIPIETVTNFHVFTAGHLFKALNEHDGNYGDMLLNRIKLDFVNQLKDKYNHISESKVEVVHGGNISEILRKQRLSKPDLISLGKHSKSDASFAKQIIRHIPGNTLLVPENAQHTLTHILIPVDLSEHSSKLLKMGLQIKQMLKKNVKITCYHAFETPQFPAYELLRSDKQFIEMIRKNNLEALHKFVDTHAAEFRSEIEEVVQKEVVDRPDRSILNYVRKHGVDFLIMGTKGHSAIDAFLGSTTERVIAKNENIPMLIVK